MPKPQIGSLIVFEGTDASGKSVQSKLLIKYLKNKGQPLAYFDFPRYESAQGQYIAQYLRGELGPISAVSPYLLAVLFALDRSEVADSIKDFLNKDYIVICNRYTPSNMAHQGAKINGEKEQDQFVRWVSDLEYKQHKIPHESYVIYLDIPIQISTKLQKNRENPPHLENRQDIQEVDTKYQRKVRALYNKLASTQENWITITCVDQSGNLNTPETIHNEVLKSIKIKGGLL